MKFPEQYRWKDAPFGYGSKEGDPFGMFRVPGREANGRNLKVLASDGAETGWDHVSVSLPDFKKKCPSWEEMCIIKNLFFFDSECVVQFHPAMEDHLSYHEVLHLWRSITVEFPMPPKICV